MIARDDGWTKYEHMTPRVMAFSLSPQRGEGRGEEWLIQRVGISECGEMTHHPSPSIPLPVEGRGKFALRSLGLVISALICLFAEAADIPKASEQKPDGTILLLATNATVHGKTIRYEPQPHKNTIGYWTKADEWVSWDFRVNTPGRFDVALTQSCGNGSGGSEVVFSIGDQAINDLVPETGSFTNWTNRIIGTFTLNTAGPYTVSVKPQTKPGLAVMDLRAITLTLKQ